jgi:hypothetical protein
MFLKWEGPDWSDWCRGARRQLATSGAKKKKKKKKKTQRKKTEQGRQACVNELDRYPLSSFFLSYQWLPSVSSSKRFLKPLSSIRRWIIAESVGTAIKQKLTPIPSPDGGCPKYSLEKFQA